MGIINNKKYQENTLDTLTNHSYVMPDPECYIYFFHTGDYIILPTYPDLISDNMVVSFNSSTPLGRSAPIQSYAGSGPRTIQFTFNLHRDMMWQLNYENTSIGDTVIEDDDYVDLMARRIQGAALPEYSVTDKMVSPPIVAVKIGTEVFIKGVVGNSVGVVYLPPILKSGKYASIQITFSVIEVTPYSASKAMELGSYRSLDYTLGTNLVYTATRTTTATRNGGTTVTSATTAQSILNSYNKTHSYGTEDYAN